MPLRRFLAPALAVLTGALSALTFAVPAHAVDMDCGDFASQKAAQIWFLKHGGPQSDPSGLDYDGDGIACESNPAPYYYKKTLPTGTVSSAPKRVVQLGRIVKVVDGDTVDVRLKSGATRRVRLVGIDTPEVYGGVQCGGPQASKALHRKLPVGKRVKLVSDPSQDLKDRYGRLLRYVIRRSDARDMNRSQIYDGWARVYVYNHNPFNRVTSYRSAQQAAKAAPRGIWKTC